MIGTLNPEQAQECGERAIREAVRRDALPKACTSDCKCQCGKQVCACLDGQRTALIYQPSKLDEFLARFMYVETDRPLAEPRGGGVE